MPTTIDSAGITFNDATSLTSAVLAANSVGATQITNGSVTAAKLGTTEQKQICKAWVNFDGTNAFSPNPSTTAIRSSYNVSSVTKNATGDYTVNLTTPMSDANYSICGSTGASSGDTALGSIYLYDNGTARTTSLFRIATRISPVTNSNIPQINIQVFGN
jgi:hypothetical protein